MTKTWSSGYYSPNNQQYIPTWYALEFVAPTFIGIEARAPEINDVGIGKSDLKIHSLDYTLLDHVWSPTLFALSIILLLVRVGTVLCCENTTECVLCPA